MKEIVKLSIGATVEVDSEVIKTWEFGKLVGLCYAPTNGERMYAVSKLLSSLVGPQGENDIVRYFLENENRKPTYEEMATITFELINHFKEQDSDVKKS